MPKRDWFADAFGAAVADIRNRWEEFAYGRALTPHHPASSPADNRDSPLSQRFGWDVPGQRPPDPERDPPSQGHDLDR